MRLLKQSEVNLYGCASFFKRARNIASFFNRDIVVSSGGTTLSKP